MVYAAGASKEADYFSMKPKRISEVPPTSDDFSGWTGPSSKHLDTPAQPTPSTSSAGGFIGRLRQLGKISKRPSGEDATGVADPAATQYKPNQAKESKVSTI